jgi:hypothetical protein
MFRRIIFVVGFVGIIAIVAIGAGPLMSRVEQPVYTVAEQEGSIELRDYAPMIFAEAEVLGERKTAINEGFHLIAAYIFGANHPKAKIAMTAPVQQQASQKIAMTAPVTQQSQSSDQWTVRLSCRQNGRWKHFLSQTTRA